MRTPKSVGLRGADVLVAALEDERKRIALDLHDGLGQSLALIRLSLQDSASLLASGATQRARDTLQLAVERTEDALAEVRRVSMALRPAILDDLGILPTLSWCLREFEAGCAEIRVEKRFLVAEGQIPRPLHTAIYRIVQEALHNVIKHASADLVRVRIERIASGLNLSVRDNGRGFVPQRIEAGACLGMIGMRERALLSGGAFAVQSAPGRGTCISVSWPDRETIERIQ